MYRILLVRTRVLISFPLVWIPEAMLSVESVVRGYHVYKNDWSPSVGGQLELEIEELYRHDRYTVAISQWQYCRPCASQILEHCTLFH